ncbi:MAG: Xaa-Pro peptidase family protein [Ignavibacteriaceae bacterium]|nr:Xaa-Pro peptidase family protein [Ignavibacteriaceae bacterium]
MDNTILKEKITQAVEILKEKDIDMWLTFVRESSVMTDPAMEMVVGTNSTWQAAFCINKDGDTTAIIGSMEEGNFKKAGVFNNIITYLKSIREPFREYIAKKNPKKIAINYSKTSVLADGLTYGMYQILLDHLEGTEYRNKLISSEEIISALRGRKSQTEVSLMKEAINETLKIFDAVTNFMKPRMTEIDVANYVRKLYTEKGYEAGWEEDHCPAVFAGPNPNGPHEGPSDKVIKKGTVVNMDFGIKYKGYCSDLQRTWYILNDGETKAPAPVQKGFEVIRDSIQKVADAVKPGVRGVDMDTIARSYITQNGYPEYPHGLGHQVGKTVHDGVAGMFPAWERYGNAPFIPLEERQIFTIEPRLPIEGYGVATIEEEVIITKNGCEFISPPQKELILVKP